MVESLVRAHLPLVHLDRVSLVSGWPHVDFSLIHTQVQLQVSWFENVEWAFNGMQQ